MDSFGTRLKYLRIKNNVYQKDIAELLNITARQLQKYEKDESDVPISKAIILADFFNVSLDYLAGRSDNPERY